MPTSAVLDSTFPALNALFEQDDGYHSDDHHTQDSGDKDIDVRVAEDGRVRDRGSGITPCGSVGVIVWCVCDCVCVCVCGVGVCGVGVCGVGVCGVGVCGVGVCGVYE